MHRLTVNAAITSDGELIANTKVNPKKYKAFQNVCDLFCNYVFKQNNRAAADQKSIQLLKKTSKKQEAKHSYFLPCSLIILCQKEIDFHLKQALDAEKSIVVDGNMYVCFRFSIE